MDEREWGGLPDGTLLEPWIRDLGAPDEETARQTLREFYLSCYPQLRTLAEHRLGGEDGAEDVVHEVFADLWGRRKSLSLHGNVGGYLVAAVRYQCDKRKRQAARSVALDAATTRGATVWPTFVPTPDERIHRVELLERVQESLAGLSEGRRQVVHLLLRGCTRGEIAQALSISENAVDLRVSRVRRQLKPLRQTLHDELWEGRKVTPRAEEGGPG